MTRRLLLVICILVSFAFAATAYRVTTPAVAAGSISSSAPMLAPRSGHSATLLPNGKVLIAGGSDERGWKGNLSSVEIYDPHSGKFTPAASLNDSRFKLPDEAVQLPSGMLLIAGG